MSPILWMPLWLSATSVAGERPSGRVPSPDREAGASATAPTSAPTAAPPAAPSDLAIPAPEAPAEPTTEAAPTLDPSAVIQAAVPAETETGPGCLKVTSVTKTADLGKDALYSVFNVRLLNACGQPVLSYAGTLSFTSKKGPISQSMGIYSVGGVPLEGAPAMWRFRVVQTAEDIWLNTAPTASMSWSWTSGYVLLDDGTVYRGDAPIPDARR